LKARAKIGVDHLIPFLPAHPHQRAIPGNAGIVHKNINWAFIGHDLVDASLTRVIISHIKFVGFKASLGFEFLCCFIIASVIRRDVITSIAQSFTDCAANAAGPTGDHCYSCHDTLP